ncbi:chlorophyl binding protein [Aureococcus anophagefferens]|nr:chlorophyl binding protein [Aureococcus anophagefferens]
MSRKKHVKSCERNPSAGSPGQGAADRPASPAPRRCPASPSSLTRRPAAAAKAPGSKRKADDDASSGGGTTRSGRAKGVVSRYDPTAVARAPQRGAAVAAAPVAAAAVGPGVAGLPREPRRLEPAAAAGVGRARASSSTPPPDALALEALAAKMDVSRARSALERRAVGVQSGARPGRGECEALLEAHGGDVNHVAKQRCGDDAPLRRSVTGDLLAALYARRTYYGDDDSSVGAFEAEHGVDDDASDSESSEEGDDDGARVVVCDDWAGERAVRESVLLPLADRAARRFYDRARASWGGASWDLRRGKTGAETLAPQICEPGNPNARYTVLCVEIYVDSDDNTPVMAFRWFYKKSDLDKKLGADVDAKDELVLARSIHSTPLEYVRGAVVVHDSDGPAKAAGPKGKRAPVFFCTRDYDERKKKLYKRQL